jgi:hypothetical protein
VSFVAACREEFWIVGKTASSDYIQQVSLLDVPDSLDNFARCFQKRAEIPLPLNLLMTEQELAFALEKLHVLLNPSTYSHRILILGSPKIESYLEAEWRQGVSRVYGRLGGITV